MNYKFYFRVFKKYCQHHMGRSKPVAALFRINSRCNLNCKYCVVKDMEFKELSTKEVINLLEDIDRLGVAYLTLSGGEPLLRKDFKLVANKIAELGFYCALNTNGTLITSKNARILANSFDMIKISIDGDRLTHDKLRGKKGSYEKAVNAIKILHRLSQRRAKIFLHFLVNKDNVSQMDLVYNEFRDISDSMSFMPVVDSDNNSNIFNDTAFIEKWHKYCSKNKLNQIEEMSHDVSSKIGKKFCDAGKLYFHILPDGNVSPCSSISSIVFGNIKDTKLKDILSSINQEHHKQIKECEGCYSRCSTEVSMLMRKTPMELLKLTPKIIRRYKF